LAGEISAAQTEYLQIVLKNSLQLRDMIGDLLEVTRAQAGKLTIEPELISLCDLFHPIIQTYAGRAAAKGLDFLAGCPGCPSELPPVHADPNRIGQVLSNLLDNALKFTTNGVISIGCCRDEHDGADSLSHVFDRLYQSPNTVEMSRKGLGLGLHICQHLVDLHGGKIWVESKEGEGTTIFFTLPIATVAEGSNQS
jgi:signal transduction histidine kinase